MSHVVSVDIKITDIKALQMACAELGLTFKPNQQTHAWYGKWVNDYNEDNAAFRQGIKPEDYGKCVHAIGVPGSGYEIGVVKHQSGEGFTLAWDFFGTGKKINDTIGAGGEKLKQMYGVCKATLIAKSKGYIVSRSTLPNGTVKLQVSGV